MNIIIGTLLVLVLLPLTLLVLYEWFLAVSSFFYRQATAGTGNRHARFLVLIPAHNEEAGIQSTLESVSNLEYPQDRYRVLAIADRCTDGTAALTRKSGAQCFERI